MEVQVKETRGRKKKYDFVSMEVGDLIQFNETSTRNIIFLAKRQNKEFPDKKFRCYTEEDGSIVLVRVK